MIFCIVAKLFGSGLGIYAAYRGSWGPYIEAFLIGVLPIWLEVLASSFTKYEPAREYRLSVKISDNVVDGLVFLVIPSLWFYAQTRNTWALIIFVLSGLYRLFKFVRTGLTEGDFFVGLPVTYTGYIWIILILLNNLWIQWSLLLILAWAMNSKFIKIKAPKYETT